MHDRALLYYRLLTQAFGDAQRIVRAPSQIEVSEFVEDNDSTVKEGVFAELNTLSVIYNKPRTMWLSKLPVPKYSTVRLAFPNLVS